MEIKDQNILILFCLFRVGDFYETFHEDASYNIKSARNNVLTKRGSGAK